MATDTVNLRQLGYIVLPASFAIALIALVSKLNSKKNKADQTLPTVHWKWFSRSQQLLGTPYRAMLAVETYKPLYGDILQLSEPFKQIVMLNSYEVASDVLEKLSEVTSDRPRNVVVVEMTGLNRQIAFRNHDEGHKRLRRVIASGLHPAAARSYTDMHTSTTAFFLLDVFNRITQRTGNDRNAIDTKSPDTNYHSKAVTASIKDSIGRFIMRMAFGYIVEENDPLLQRQNALLDEVISNLATHYWANDFPILCHLPSWFPGAEFKRRMDRIYSMRQRALRETFETVLQKAVRGDILPPSYTSNLIELKGGRNIDEADTELIRWTSTAIFGAGSSTTTTLVNSFIFTMCIRPEIASKVQAEIDAQIGRERIPTLDDRGVLPYTDAVLQEVARHCPVFPLGLEHVAREDIEVRGYKIKKGTVLEGNIWAVMHDPALYSDPYTFNPERFLKERPETDPRRFLFGFGRRVCPGQHVANNGTFVMAAAFMSVFNISASEETMRKVESCTNEPWKMFKPYGAFDPLPYGCEISVRDKAAASVLETCKEVAIMT